LSFSADARESATYDGEPVPALAVRWSLPAVHAFADVGSTLDVAHAIAPTAASGTLVVADEQTAGRGRHGRRWTSAPRAGVWLTLIERPTDARALDVLAIRCGLLAAQALDALAGTTVRVKWPNDLFVGNRKLAGTLIETRWRGTAPEWVAIGFGLNVLAPDIETGVGLPTGVRRIMVLDAVIPALRRAASATRHLTDAEVAAWRERDLATGLLVTAPSVGTVEGITSTGEILVRANSGVTAHRSGSLDFAEPLSCS
jgi:BirA family biotin operon repressor/biotin-[acetyl-CoA-carboxylase] ligase